MTCNLSVTAQLVGSAVPCRFMAVLYKNGAAYQTMANTDGGTGKPFGASFTTAVRGNGTDFYEVYVWQDSGFALDIAGTAQDTSFSAVTSH